MSRLFQHLLHAILVLLALALPAAAAPVLATYLPEVTASDLVPGADGFGAIREDLPVAPVLKGDTLVGYVFLNSQQVDATGYSGKPIHIAVGLDLEGTIVGAKLVAHSEPIVLIGIPDAKVQALAADYAGLDLVAEAAAGGRRRALPAATLIKSLVPLYLGKVATLVAETEAGSAEEAEARLEELALAWEKAKGEIETLWGRPP